MVTVDPGWRVKWTVMMKGGGCMYVTRGNDWLMPSFRGERQKVFV